MKSFSGVLLIDKPEGVSSASVLNRVKRVLPRGTKIGHGGTLDPFATGLLVALIGSATRLSRCFLSSDKEYEATIRFGIRTDSGDYTGNIIEQSDFIPTGEAEMQKTANLFLGEYLQTPPMFSAVKVNGRPLYELARAGEEIARTPKARRIDAFELIDFHLPEVRARVVSSGGTYIRTLAEDWAKRLSAIAMLNSLRRTRSGRFKIQDAMKIEEVVDFLDSQRERGSESPRLAVWPRAFISIDRVFDTKEGIQTEEPLTMRLLNGEKRAIEEVALRIRARISELNSEANPTEHPYPVFDSVGRLIGLFFGETLGAIFNQTRGEM